MQRTLLSIGVKLSLSFQEQTAGEVRRVELDFSSCVNSRVRAWPFSPQRREGAKVLLRSFPDHCEKLCASVPLR